MLASTVQFSNNDQAHHQHPTPTHPNHTAEAGCTGPAAPTVPHHHRTKRPGARGDPKKPVTLRRLFPQDPTVCLGAHPVPTRPRSHPAPKRETY